MRLTSSLMALTSAGVLLTSASACGVSTTNAYSPDQGHPMVATDVNAVIAQVRATGKPAYYLGNAVGDLPLTALDLVEENAPAFQVQADYGTCQPAADGGCADPVVVSTTDLVPEVQGTHCRRLDPQLGVSAGVLMGELTLVSGDLVITVSDFRAREGGDDGIESALRLLPRLRALGQTAPARTLPPPSPAAAAWMDQVCGSAPGGQASHDLDGRPGALDNSHVPDFTVERLGGGELTWGDYRGKPVVIAVGTVAQVSVALRRLQPLVSAAASHPTLLGLVTDPTGDKFNPRPVTEIEREAGPLPAPIGYAAVPLSAMWFLDAASNTGAGPALDTGTIAFVDSSGVVTRFAGPSTPDAQLSESARALG